MRKETIEIGTEFGTEYKGKYVFQEISWAKRSRIIQRHTKYSQMTGQVQSSDYVAIQAETIMASLKEQPENKSISLEKLLSEDEGIPVGLGEVLSQVANRVNSLTREESTFLSEPSEEASQTLPLRSTGSAKSSGGPRTSSESSQRKRCKSSL
jgi:hypothetical protein